MGFSTNITISNDFWHEIAADPQKLVDAIAVAMNDGIEDPQHETFVEHHPEHYQVDYVGYVKRMVPQGVTVHRAMHNDIPQVICSTYGSHAIAAHEIPWAIRDGWLDGYEYRARQAEAVAKELHRLAGQIRSEARKAEKRKQATGTTRHPSAL